MIKRVILDIDNTLIPWKEEYYEEIKNVLKDLKIKYIDTELNEIKQALNEYENEYYIFDRELMIKYINKYTKKEYPKELIYELTNKWAHCVPEKIERETEETLQYLKSKYELVILTDWYADQQKERLQKLDILKYFSDVYSAEKAKRKPFKEAFMQAIGKNKPEECIMIGDNIERDIKGAINAGLQAIYYNPKNNKEEYKMITRIDELQQIL